MEQLYIAIPIAVTDIYENGTTEKSKALGMFCVKPEIKKGLFGKIIITAFEEVLTGEKIIQCNSYLIESQRKHVYNIIEKDAQIGDLAWQIVDKPTVDRLLSPEELQKNLPSSPEEAHERLENLRIQAKAITQQSEQSTGKKL